MAIFLEEVTSTSSQSSSGIAGTKGINTATKAAKTASHDLTCAHRRTKAQAPGDSLLSAMLRLEPTGKASKDGHERCHRSFLGQGDVQLSTRSVLGPGSCRMALKGRGATPR